MSDQTMIPLKQLMKELSDDLGIEFIETLMSLGNHLKQMLRENFDRVENGGDDWEKLPEEIAKSTFDFTVRAMIPLWQKLYSVEREIKFLRQK